MKLGASTKVKEATLSAKVIRADGTVEDLGLISYSTSNPIKKIIYWFMVRRTKAKILAMRGTNYG